MAELSTQVLLPARGVKWGCWLGACGLDSPVSQLSGLMAERDLSSLGDLAWIFLQWAQKNAKTGSPGQGLAVSPLLTSVEQMDSCTSPGGGDRLHLSWRKGKEFWDQL